MARVLALTADLLFGSRVQAALTAAGHDVQLVGDEAALQERLAGEGSRQQAREGSGQDGGAPVQVLVVDLTDERLRGTEVVEALARRQPPSSLRTLGFYSHVDTDTRARAELAGFDLLVPRSRMAREGAQLVGRLSEAA